MIHLHVHSIYSLLDAMIKFPALAEKLKELGQDTIAITDHGNLYAAVEALSVLGKEGIKVINGSEVYICTDANVNDKDNKYYHLILLAKNETGRQNLNWLVSESSKHKYYGKPRIDFNMLTEHHEGLICLSACMAGEVQRALAVGDVSGAKIIATKYKNLFQDDYYLEYQSHRNDEQQRLNKAVIELATELGIEYVVTADAHYLNKEDQKYHDMFVQIGTQREAGETYDDCYIQSEDEVKELCWMTRKYNDIAIQNTHKIADKCTNTIPLSAPIMPHVDIPDGYKSEKAYLQDLCNKGFEKKGFKNWTIEQWQNYFSDLPEGSDVIPPDCKTAKDYRNIYIQRAKYEMNAIDEMGFIGYYLLVYSYGNSVKRRGLARGSGAGSLLAYLCNIVDVDPVKYKLYFERFIDVGALDLLHEGSITKKELKVPDFDLDFSPSERDKVLQFIVGRYGNERVVNLGQFSYIWAKGAIKDIGRVLNIPFDVTNEMTKTLDQVNSNATIEEALELGIFDKYKDKYPELFRYASALSGLPKSFGVHPCGVCVCIQPAEYYNAIEYNEDKDTWVLQGDMHSAEDLGLVKIDLLGLRTLDAIYDTLEMIGKDYSYITPTKLDLHDKDVWNEFEQGNTDCIFQFESSGMKRTLRDMHCDSIETLSAANALYRPGSNSYIPDFVNRKNGKEKITYLHDDLKPILSNTYGVIVFQEQLIEIGRLAKLRNPDELRKATAKKKKDLMAKIEPELKNGLMARGWTQEQVDTLWDNIIDFAKYSFNKCVRGDTRLMLPDGSLSATVEEMCADNSKIPEFALSKFRAGKVKPNKVVNITESGVRYLYRITTNNGCYVDCTPNHKIPTINGIKRADELSVGDILYTYRTEDGRYKLSRVASIKYETMEMTYDVEMSAPAHNFVTGTGLLVCNSHSTAYALTAYIAMYLKVHHTGEFFTGMINSYEKVEDIAKTVKEARRMGVSVVLDDWRTAKDRTYYKDGQIHIGLSAFKGFGTGVATALKIVADKQPSTLIECIELCFENGISEPQVKTMITLGMFSEYGKSWTLLKIMELMDIRKRSQFDKEKCPYPPEIMIRFSKETAKQFRNIDGEGLFGFLCSMLKVQDLDPVDVIHTQLDILGFVLYSDKDADPRDALIVDSNADKTMYSPTVKLYSLKSGKQEDFRIHRARKGTYSRVHTAFEDYPVAVGDIIHISDFERKQKSERQNNGKYLPIEGEYEKWITEYYRTTRL